MKKHSIFVLLTILLSALLLTSCGDESCSHIDTDGDLICDGCGETLPDPKLDGKIIYKIKVLDPDGNVAPNIIVELYDGEKKIAMKMTDAEGVVKCSEEHPVEAGEAPFTVKLISPDGKALNYDESATVISDGAEEITVYLYKTTAGLPTEPLYVGDEPTMAPIVSDGKYRVDLKAGKNYFVFYATARGQYKISSDAVGASLGYYGAPFFVQDNNIASLDGTGEVFLTDGELYFNIRAFNASDDYHSASRYVIAVSVGSAVSASIEISKLDKELPLSKEELPWEDIILPAAPATFTPSFTVGSAEELTPVSITDPDFKAVYNAEDGFYHAGTVDGPVILVKLSVDSEYLASFKKIMETTQFSGYVYDENGDLLAKKNYHGMMEKYIEAAGELGVYPLTSYLKDALTTVGNAWGWYTEGGANNIFTGKLTAPVISENAYLFACCYYEEK